MLLAQRSHAQLLYDNFNGTSIDANLWSVHHPFTDSSAAEAGGIMTIRNRGGLISQSSLTGTLQIDGRFQFSGNTHDLFTFVIRTNGVSTQPQGTFDNGIRFNWLKQSDAGTPLNIVSIDEIVAGGSDINLALGNYNFQYNQYYDFRITDDGTHLALYFVDMQAPLLTASNSTHGGNRIGFYNREGAEAGSSISDGSQVQMDYISVVPEPSTILLVLTFGALSFWHRRR